MRVIYPDCVDMRKNQSEGQGSSKSRSLHSGVSTGRRLILPWINVVISTIKVLEKMIITDLDSMLFDDSGLLVGTHRCYRTMGIFWK